MEKPMGAKTPLLEQFKSNIFEMRQKGYSYRQIADWLNKKGITVTPMTVNRFVLKNK
ncbi:recombinase family protein [Arsenophonus sp. ENCA]|uniref:recombinase family protein n=1 Tax=Arsenophonus sp. ENCA TaxID=1987579 RepID=UPI0025BF3AE5|nr:recombinase family protein [Arsenophonus sp. ENCA]